MKASPTQEKIIREIAKDYGLSIEEVEKIVYSPFKLVKLVISQGNFESVRIPYFGLFSVNPYHLKKILENVNKKQDDKAV